MSKSWLIIDIVVWKMKFNFLDEPRWLIEVREASYLKLSDVDQIRGKVEVEFGSRKNEIETSSLRALQNISRVLAKQNIHYLNLRDAIRKIPSEVEQAFAKLSDDQTPPHFFDSFWKSGTFIAIPDQLKCEHPFQPYQHSEKSATSDRTLMVLGEDSSAEFFTGCFSSPGEEGGRLYDFILHSKSKVLVGVFRNGSFVRPSQFRFYVSKGCEVEFVDFCLKGEASDLVFFVSRGETEGTSVTQHFVDLVGRKIKTNKSVSRSGNWSKTERLWSKEDDQILYKAIMARIPPEFSAELSDY